MLLLDDDGHDLPPTIEIRPGRGFRKEWLLIVAAVAVVVGVGLVGDGGQSEPAASPATTTSAVPTTVHRRFTATVRRFPPTTTTTLAAGPVAPFPTGTAIAYMGSGGSVNVLDLDTGLRCSIDAPPSDVGVSFFGPSSTTTGPALIPTGRGLTLVDAGCASQTFELSRSSYPLAIGDERFWTTDQDGSRGTGPLVEHDLRTGKATGRTVDASPYVGPAVSSGDRLVVGMAGQMTEVTGRGNLHDLGPGIPVALHGTSLASVRCEQLRCRLYVTDLDSAATKVVSPIWLAVVPWGPGTFSPDGSLLVVQTQQPGEHHPRAALIDVNTGIVRLLPQEYLQATFTVDGAHLIAGDGSWSLVVLSLDGTQAWPIDAKTQSGVYAMPGRASY